MIARTAHFVCLDDRFVWAHSLSIRAALSAGRFTRAVLHHSEDLTSSTGWAALTGLAGFEPVRLDDPLIPDGTPSARALRRILAEVADPRAREDVVRAALLWEHGGVFLSLDTVAVASFEDVLSRDEFFCGESVTQQTSGSKRVRAAAALRRGVGRALDRAPSVATTMLADLWPTSASNVVMGAPSEDPFVSRLLGEIAGTSVERRRSPGALGTTALESAFAHSRAGTVLYPNSVFDPTRGPQASWWFRTPPPTELAALGARETLALRWHDEIAPRAAVDAADEPCRDGRHLFGALAASFQR